VSFGAIVPGASAARHLGAGPGSPRSCSSSSGSARAVCPARLFFRRMFLSCLSRFCPSCESVVLKTRAAGPANRARRRWLVLGKVSSLRLRRPRECPGASGRSSQPGRSPLCYDIPRPHQGVGQLFSDCAGSVASAGAGRRDSVRLRSANLLQPRRATRILYRTSPARQLSARK
jgi:hypothetical protein